MKVDSNNLVKGHLLVDGTQLVEVVHVTPKRKFIHVINLTESKEVQPKRRLLYKPFEGSTIYKRSSYLGLACKTCSLRKECNVTGLVSDCLGSACLYTEVQA